MTTPSAELSAKIDQIFKKYNGRYGVFAIGDSLPDGTLPVHFYNDRSEPQDQLLECVRQEAPPFNPQICPVPHARKSRPWLVRVKKRRHCDNSIAGSLD